jgi:pimeloyl-ACP methyl ester carboxylesterase
MRSRHHSGPPGSFQRLSRDLLERAFPATDGQQLDEQATAVTAEVQRDLRTDGFSNASEVQASGGPRLPGRFAIIAGVAGVAVGIGASWELTRYSTFVALLAGAMVTGFSTLAIYWWLLRRKQLTGVVEGVIQIPKTALQMLEADQEAPGGELLHYLEAKRESDELVVFVHGLGLDATDFRGYLAESKYHSVALTLYGFNAEEKYDDDYSPISLKSHAQLFGLALQKLQGQYPGKRLSLVGFSVGADIILLLSELAGGVLAGLKIHRVLLLDPNINRSTTTISSRIADLDAGQPLEQFIEVLRSATSMNELRYLCEYVYKTTSKDIAQVRRHAKEISDVWDESGTDQFVDYVTRLTKVSGGIYIVLSLGQKSLLEELRDRAFDCGLNPEHFSWSSSGHFELLDPSFLRRQLGSIL